ncbi:unnamed protein product [Rhizoctonia solani]|uniref:O-methylsterigmatocystin oxidoreductase n=1 Tax=Rhizoctonia solani TaxID=456999 RepID=A0A8H2XV91_9AGAM|nr:unnamed protein product [Rhizoctonia solani]
MPSLILPSVLTISPRTVFYASLTLPGLLLLRQLLKSRKHNPPSPLSIPIVGHLLSIPADPENIAFLKLGKQLNSDIIYLRLFGYDFVVLNSAEAASELLDKRSGLYSDRLCTPMMGHPSLFDWSQHSAILGYGDAWRSTRRMINNWLNVRAVTQFHDIQTRQARLLLRRLVDLSDEPQPFVKVKREFIYTMASSMFQLIYGYELQSSRDIYFENARVTTDNASSAAMFTNFLVNVFPLLVHVPDWFPGTSWKRTAREWRALKEEAINAPFEWTKTQMTNGVAQPSIVSSLLQDHSSTVGWSPEEKEMRVKEAAAALYQGGADTSAMSLVNLVAAMVTHPHVQTRAQQELDDVLGPETLPIATDRERLPYIQNLVREILRWRPVLPIGVPHVCWQNDVYRKYDIRKGTVILAPLASVTYGRGSTSYTCILPIKRIYALRAMSRDESFYKDPDVFNPDRYLDPSVPVIPAFGWGRRKCPGIHFAESSLFVTIASLLAVFTFSRKKGSDGKEITPNIESEANVVVVQHPDWLPRAQGVCREKLIPWDWKPSKSLDKKEALPAGQFPAFAKLLKYDVNWAPPITSSTMNPTPLASHTVSLALQYLLPPSELPTHLISRSLLQRHHFLSISPSDPAAYFCWPHPNADPEKSVTALEQLATQDHEWLVRTAEIRYQPQADAVQARVWLGNTIQLVFVWEEDQDGAGWRYFDADHRPLPSNCSATLAPALQVTPPEQDQEQDVSAGGSYLSFGLASHSSLSTPTSDDYWAGYDSGSSPRSPRIPERELTADDEDAYWASYGAVHGSADSTVPSPAPQKKRLDAWGREELPWEEHTDLDAQAWDADETASRHGLGVTILSNSRPPTPPSMPTRTLVISTQTHQPQQIAPLPDLNHRNWTSPPSSLSAPFSALSEPDDAPLDEEPKNEPEDSGVEDAVDSVPTASIRDPPTSNKVPSALDTGLSSAIKGMYAMWLTSRQDPGSEESRQEFMELVKGALIDA